MLYHISQMCSWYILCLSPCPFPPLYSSYSVSENFFLSIFLVISPLPSLVSRTLWLAAYPRGLVHRPS